MVAVLELGSPRQLVRRLSCRVGVLIAPRHRVQKINCRLYGAGHVIYGIVLEQEVGNSIQVRVTHSITYLLKSNVKFRCVGYY